MESSISLWNCSVHSWVDGLWGWQLAQTYRYGLQLQSEFRRVHFCCTFCTCRPHQDQHDPRITGSPICRWRSVVQVMPTFQYTQLCAWNPRNCGRSTNIGYLQIDWGWFGLERSSFGLVHDIQNLPLRPSIDGRFASGDSVFLYRANQADEHCSTWRPAGLVLPYSDSLTSIFLM